MRPVLYDSKHPNYKSRESKIQAWNEVAQAMNITGIKVNLVPICCAKMNIVANECEVKWNGKVCQGKKIKGC